ncbi:hypothetical protein AB1Y20_001125 [Prymnesium parvum]|uniref:Uncharacterized protein n=1 Tax=Prymnesium parvum TaxID=97485 RepID=A0AB34K7U9_PRYPA
MEKDAVLCGSGIDRPGPRYAELKHALGSPPDDSPAVAGYGGLRFPPFPGENPLQHEAHIWLEIAEARMASAGLLIVANGGTPAAARHIVDVPLDRLPPLPPDHRDYERRMETRIRIETENDKNAARAPGVTTITIQYFH